MTVRSPDAGRPCACLVCDGTLRPARRLAPLLECSQCSFVTAGLELSETDHRRIYGHDYFHGAEYADYIAEADSLKLNFNRRLDTLGRFVVHAHSKSLFEIGCAYGFFLETASTRFQCAAGIDISAEAVAYGRNTLGVDARVGDYIEHHLATRPDVVCLWDTIEHLRAPDEYIAKVGRDIAPGGILAITTGDIGSLNARLRGPRWRLIHPPTHLHYFSADTLRRLLERNGFEVIHVEHPGQARTLRSILYITLVLRGRRNNLYRRMERLPGLDLGVTLNFFDIMYVVARHRRVPGQRKGSPPQPRQPKSLQQAPQLQ
jgi:SAM-dependent methyltransferase